MILIKIMTYNDVDNDNVLRCSVYCWVHVDVDNDKDDDKIMIMTIILTMIAFQGAVFTVGCRWKRAAAAFREESIHLLRKPHHLHHHNYNHHS